MYLKIKNIEEKRKINYVYDMDGNMLNMFVLPNSESILLQLETPKGEIVNVNIAYHEFMNKIQPELRPNG